MCIPPAKATAGTSIVTATKHRGSSAAPSAPRFRRLGRPSPDDSGGTGRANALTAMLVANQQMRRLTLAAVPTDGFAIGIVLQGTYRILRPLAEGGCGEVYLAAHTRLPGRFAIKLLHRSLVRDNDALTRFRQEAEITSSLRHPHIVQVFDFNVTDSGVPYLVMELLEGKLLSQRVTSAGALEPSVAVDIIDQTASALHAAHSRGIVHRDLKPENIMLLSGAGVA